LINVKDICTDSMSEQPGKRRNFFVRLLKFFGWILLSIILILIVIALVIQLPPVQNKLTQKAVTFLEEKIGTEVSLDHISISFPKTIVLEGLYFEDQKKDTLLYAGRFAVNTDLWALTKREIQLNEISLKNAKAYISRPENDSSYNFSYILKAFAGDSTATPDTLEQKGWNISVEEIDFEKITTKYHDYLTGNIADLYLGEFEVSISEFDLDSMKIVVDEILLKNTRADVLQTKQPEVTEEVAEEKQPITYDIGVGEVTLENLDINFNQQALGTSLKLAIDKSVLKTDKIDLKSQKIDLKSFSLHNSFIAFQQRAATLKTIKSQTDPEPKSEKRTEENRIWTISLNKLDLSGNGVQFYDHTKPQTKDAVDFDHLWLSGLLLQAEDIVLHGNNIKAEVKNMAFSDRSGFTVKSLKAGLALKDNGVDINQLLLVTGNSRFQVDARASFQSLATIAQNPDKTKFTADINQTSIGWRDVLYFQPTLKDSLPLTLGSSARIDIDGAARGTVADINIHHFNINAFDKTVLKIKGTLKNLPDPKKLSINIDLDKLYTTRADLQKILPDTLIPPTISLPEWINVKGNYNGSLSKSSFTTLLNSSIGQIDAKGKFNLDSTSVDRGYTAELNVNDLDLGTLLQKQDTLGKVTLTTSVDVKGLHPEEMNGTFHALMKSFEYQKYEYQNFKLDGDIINGVYKGSAGLKDKNLEFVLVGDINYSEKVPQYNITFDLKNADFKALHLSERPLKARGILQTNLATPDFKVLNGNLGLRKVAIFNGEKLYAVDSLLFASIDETGRSELTIESDLLSGKFEGSFNITQLPEALKEYFGTYYTLHDSSLVAKEDAPRQYFNFNLKLKKTELLTDILVPQLTQFVPGDIKGQFDSEAKKLEMNIDIEAIQYATIGVKSFGIRTNSDSHQLNYNIFADQILIDSLKVDGFEFNGSVANDSVNTNIIILDSADRQKYLIGALFTSLATGNQIHLLPDQVKLNYVDWTVSKDNYIRFGGSKILANNVQLTNGNEKIIIDSKDDPAKTLFIGFRELNLEYLLSMVNREKPVSGLLHGDIFIIPDTANMTFTADLGIRDFNISEIPWGDIHFAVDRKTKNRFDVGFGIQSKENNVVANGYYLTGEKPAIDLTATITRLNLTTLEPVTMGQMKDMKGQVTGQLKIRGSTQAPSVRGFFKFGNVSFFSTYVQSDFTINNQQIDLTNRGVAFNDFTILDHDNNKATIDGLIETVDYKKFGFNLNLVTDKFRLLNTSENDNELFYGRVDINATVKVRGTMTQPVVDMQVGLSDDSHLTYVVPQAEAGIMEQQGIVKFVDKTFKDDKFIKNVSKEDTVKSKYTGLDLTARIELTDKEKFTVIIDPTTGDQLTVKGNTTLTLEMDPTGDLDLSGRYEISEGTYNLSFYKFLKREFKIDPGSTMTWSGDPLNAAMDMSAIFEVETAPIDLLSAQLTGSDQQELNRYKQRLPFQVYLNIKGQLLKPEISFKLDMPIEERNYAGGNVYSRIQDINTRESDLNKQVFALLILKRFISDNPFENQGASGFEGTARTSVSKILTEQLNRLSQNIRGVELSFDVKSYEDYSSGQAQGQTQLQLGLSKNLFNDRLVVKVAGNVGVEGQTNTEVTDYIGDLALEYKLTEDGRFRITGFRNSNYDMIDGELTETGTGLIYVKDYNLLSELFKANAKNKK
jgi:translocation and assembly module TamB